MELPGTAKQWSCWDWLGDGRAKQGNGKALRREAKQWSSTAGRSRGTAQGGESLTGNGMARCSNAEERHRVDMRGNRKGTAEIGDEQI